MIKRTQQRIKQTGEVFTPLPLVDEILDKLPKELFTNPKKTFIDPACGDGNFLVRVVAYKIANGCTPKQALETTYGIDIMEDNIVHARDRILTHGWLASKCLGGVLPHLTPEDERQAGQAKGRDTFARKYDHIVVRNIIQGDTLKLDFSGEWPPTDSSKLVE